MDSELEARSKDAMHSLDDLSYSTNIRDESIRNRLRKHSQTVKDLRTQLANTRSAIPKREYPPFLKVETLAHEALYLVEQVETYRDECEAIRTKLAAEEKRAEEAEAREASLLEALAPSIASKQAYMCQFSFGFPELDSENNKYMRRVNVPWETIMEIMGVIKARAIAARQGEGGTPND